MVSCRHEARNISYWSTPSNMRASAAADATATARAHGRDTKAKPIPMIAKAAARTTSSARVDWARPAALTPSQIPYATAPEIGMKNVASAQYWATAWPI